MKKLLFISMFVVILSCNNKNEAVQNQEVIAEIEAYEALKAEEDQTRQVMQSYIEAVNSTDWKSEVRKYLKSGPALDAFIEEHSAFRTSFPNFHTSIKHIVVEGNKGIVWLNETATYAETYSFQSLNDSYGDNVLAGVKAKNQALQWSEVWHFDVVNDKFGDTWDFMKDNYAVMKGLEVLKE